MASPLFSRRARNRLHKVPAPGLILPLMHPIVALILLLLLLAGPIAAAPLERNIEFYFLGLGLLAIVLAGRLNWEILFDATRAPILIAAAVAAAGLIFGAVRNRLDRLFERLESKISRPYLTALSVFVIAMLSSVVTAIVAALLLVETIGLLRLPERPRIGVAVSGCFAIGLGASLTPLGEPLATLAAHAMGLPFLGLFRLLGLYTMPGILFCSAIAGFFARKWELDRAEIPHVEERSHDVLMQTIKVYAFVAGLVLVSDAFAPLATQYVNRMSAPKLFWLNTISAALDNATLVALEVHRMDAGRARAAIIALLVSGGMLIPGNVPNIVSAGLLRIGSLAWAKVGIPMGLVMMTAYFLVLTWRG